MSSSTKAQIIFPEDLLTEVDRLVGGRKRSEFVVAATREKLARVRFQKALLKAAGAWSAENHPETRSQAALTRWLKHTRKKTQQRLQGKGRE
jgi:metal-responsive CopG/Arc/MetJ family transcriptional regulator